MYLYRRSFTCTGPASVIPHLMADVLDTAQQASGQEISMWRGAAGPSNLDFRWEMHGSDPDDLRAAFDVLRGDRATVALLDELVGHGWDGRHRDALGSVVEGDGALQTTRVGDLLDDREIPIDGSDRVAGLRWLQQMCVAANSLNGPGDVLISTVWADRPSFRLMRSASDMKALIDFDARCSESQAWREARRGATRHLRLDLTRRTLWRRIR